MSPAVLKLVCDALVHPEAPQGLASLDLSCTVHDTSVHSLMIGMFVCEDNVFKGESFEALFTMLTCPRGPKNLTHLALERAESRLELISAPYPTCR